MKRRQISLKLQRYPLEKSVFWNRLKQLCLEEAAAGREPLKPPFVSVLCVHNPDCWPEELSGLWCCFQWPASNGREALRTARSTPYTQAAVSTHKARRQKMSHFTYSWKEQCISLCHLQLLLSAGAWCVEGKCSGRRHGLVWGLLLPRLKSVLGQGLSYLQKKKENSREGCDWQTVLLVQ